MLYNGCPKTDPCGIHPVISLSVDFVSSILTMKVLFFRCDLTLLIVDCGRLSLDILYTRPICQTLYQMPSLCLEKLLLLIWIRLVCLWLYSLFIELWSVGFRIQTVVRVEPFSVSIFLLLLTSTIF